MIVDRDGYNPPMLGTIARQVLWMRVALGLAAVAVVAAAIYYQEEMYALLLLPLAVFLKGVAWRVGARRAALFLIVPLVTPRARRVVRSHMGRAGRWLADRARTLAAWWRRSPWALRLVIALPLFLAACAAMLAVGGFLGLLAILPFGAALRFFAAGWIGKFLLPLFARAAAGHGLDRIFPSVWRCIPAPARSYMARCNQRLWWATMRRLVRSRKIIGRRAAIVLRQTSRLGEARQRASDPSQFDRPTRV